MRNSTGLHGLIAACLDDERTLHYESRLVDEKRHTVLARLADERTTFVERLMTLGEPDARESGSWRGFVRELRRAIWVFAGGGHSGDSIAECRRSCKRTEALYDKAIRLQSSQPILPILLEQRDGIRRACGELLAIQF